MGYDPQPHTLTPLHQQQHLPARPPSAEGPTSASSSRHFGGQGQGQGFGQGQERRRPLTPSSMHLHPPPTPHHQPQQQQQQQQQQQPSFHAQQQQQPYLPRPATTGGAGYTRIRSPHSSLPQRSKPAAPAAMHAPIKGVASQQQQQHPIQQ
jgi:hypothetical protein